MEIILKQDIQNLGNKDEIVKVKNGYARNFLIPQGIAITATASAKKIIAENTKQRAHKEAKIKADAEIIAKSLEGVKLTRSLDPLIQFRLLRPFQKKDLISIVELLAFKTIR